MVDFYPKLLQTPYYLLKLKRFGLILSIRIAIICPSCSSVQLIASLSSSLLICIHQSHNFNTFLPFYMIFSTRKNKIPDERWNVTRIIQINFYSDETEPKYYSDKYFSGFDTRIFPKNPKLNWNIKRHFFFNFLSMHIIF